MSTHQCQSKTGDAGKTWTEFLLGWVQQTCVLPRSVHASRRRHQTPDLSHHQPSPHTPYHCPPVPAAVADEWYWVGWSVSPWPWTYIKYSLDFLRPIITAEAFEAVDWLADIPQQTWPQAGRSSGVILTSCLLKSTAAILAAAMFVGDRTTASTSLAGAAAVSVTVCVGGSVCPSALYKRKKRLELSTSNLVHMAAASFAKKMRSKGHRVTWLPHELVAWAYRSIWLLRFQERYHHHHHHRRRNYLEIWW